MSSVVSKPGNHLGHINYTKIQINIATVIPLHYSKLMILRYHVQLKDKMTRNFEKYIHSLGFNS